MFTFKITTIETAITRFDIYFEIFQDGELMAKDSVQIPTVSMASVASDGRNDYINQMVSDSCQKYLIAKDVTNDFKSLIGVEVSLEQPTYKTKADIQAEIDAQAQAKV